MAAINKNLSTLYLQSKGLNPKGGQIAGKDKLSSKEMKEQLAENIFQRLVNAYAMLEAAKEMKLYSEEQAEEIIQTAKTCDEKAEIKKAILKEIAKAMEIAGKDFPFYHEEKNKRKKFEYSED